MSFGDRTVSSYEGAVVGETTSDMSDAPCPSVVGEMCREFGVVRERLCGVGRGWGLGSIFRLTIFVCCFVLVFFFFFFYIYISH